MSAISWANQTLTESAVAVRMFMKPPVPGSALDGCHGPPGFGHLLSGMVTGLGVGYTLPTGTPCSRAATSV